MKMLLKTAAVLGGIALTATPAMAQSWTPGSEILGQPVVVTTNGVTNTLYFDPGGTVRMVTPTNEVIQGAWSIGSNQLCINNGATSECWPYQAPFVAMQPVSLTSSCQSSSTWTAQSTNSAMPATGGQGERGR